MRFQRTVAEAEQNLRRHPYELRQPEPRPVRRQLDWRLATVPFAGFVSGWGLMELLWGVL